MDIMGPGWKTGLMTGTGAIYYYQHAHSVTRWRAWQ
jgi:hypothetical protein